MNYKMDCGDNSLKRRREPPTNLELGKVEPSSKKSKSTVGWDSLPPELHQNIFASCLDNNQRDLTTLLPVRLVSHATKGQIESLLDLMIKAPSLSEALPNSFHKKWDEVKAQENYPENGAEEFLHTMYFDRKFEFVTDYESMIEDSADKKSFNDVTEIYLNDLKSFRRSPVLSLAVDSLDLLDQYRLFLREKNIIWKPREICLDLNEDQTLNATKIKKKEQRDKIRPTYREKMALLLVEGLQSLILRTNSATFERIVEGGVRRAENNSSKIQQLFCGITLRGLQKLGLNLFTGGERRFIKGRMLHGSDAQSLIELTPNLRQLELVDFNLSEDFLRVLERSSWMDSLQSLNFFDCFVETGETMKDLLSRDLKELQCLTMPLLQNEQDFHFMQALEALKVNASLGSLESFSFSELPSDQVLMKLIEAVTENTALVKLKTLGFESELVDEMPESTLPYEYFLKLKNCSHLQNLNFEDLKMYFDEDVSPDYRSALQL